MRSRLATLSLIFVYASVQLQFPPILSGASEAIVKWVLTLLMILAATPVTADSKGPKKSPPPQRKIQVDNQSIDATVNESIQHPPIKHTQPIQSSGAPKPAGR